MRMLSTLLTLLILASLLVPGVLAQDPAQDSAQPQGPSLEEQLKLGLITEKEFDQLAPHGPGCGPEAAWPGPDGFGYVGLEVAFDWVDITATGTLIEGLSDDGYLTGFPIGFTFPFYGTGFTTFDVANNGFIGFGLPTGTYANKCPLPSLGEPEDVIALLWDDLYYNYDTGGVYYETFGTCPFGGGGAGGCLVVEYHNWNHYGGDPGSAGTFEAILYEDGAIVLQFLDSGVEMGSSSTTGIDDDNVAGDFGLTYACNTEFSIPDELAILFTVLNDPNLSESTKSAPAKVMVGEPIDYTIEILNTGSTPALDASLVDPIPPGTTYVPDSLSCSSGVCTYDSGVVYWNGQVAPPLNGEAWQAPVGAEGQPARTTDGAANPTVDPAIAFEPPAPQGTVLLDQQPSYAFGVFSDASCDLCGGAQVLAENFALEDTATLEQIALWTGYYPNDIPIDPDVIRVIIHEDAAGLPGGVVYDESNVAYARAQTGVIVSGVHEYLHTLTLGTPAVLPAGNYWVEIYNDTGWGTDDWFWEVGNPDTMGRGLPDAAYAFEAPGTSWSYPLGYELAFQLIGSMGGEMENPVTVTFSVMPEVGCGETVVNVATIDDPGLVEPVVVEAATEVWDLILLHEDFEGDVFPPPGWVEAHDPAGTAWTDQDLKPRGNLTGGTGKFAIVDDDLAGTGALTEAQLWTPPIDIPSGYETHLVYKTDYNNIFANESADVDISLDGGATWINLQHWAEDHRGPLTVQIDLTPFAPATGAILRFYYDDGDYWAWWWEIDDVQVVGCPLPEEPDIRVEPGSLYAEQCPDEVTQQTLQVCNDGILPLEWSLTEVPPPLAGGAEIALPAGPDGVDPGTAVAAGPRQARPAGSIELQAGYGIAQPPNVLLASADNSTVIQGLLQAYGDLGAVDWYDVGYATPTLAELQAYDVVLTWSNYVYADPVGMGNVLADYVDAGGKVINLMFSMGTHGWQMGGRFMDQEYTAMNGGNILYGESCLGDYPPDHPIMAGVTNVCDTFRLEGAYPTSGSYPLAPWQDGELFIAVKNDHSAVSFAGYVGDAFLWTGQMPDVVHNAILFLAGVEQPGIPWLSEEPIGGTVDPGMCQDVTVTFDSTGLTPADYFGDLDFQSNDPDEPEVMVPVQLTVLDCTAPDIEVTPESLLAEQCPDEMTAQPLNICNVGDADLTWSLSELVPPKGTQDVLWDNGPLVTHPGGGAGGADASALQTALGMNTYGFGNQFIYSYRMADDFVVDTDWNVDQITFFAYQTNSPTDPSPIIGLYFQIWDGVPDDPGSSIVFGDLVTNRLASTSWSGIYRVLDTDLMVTARPIMANAATAGVALPPGTYWLDWITDGSLSSGPWAPPISILGEITTGNALQNTGTWVPALDTGTNTQQGMPFVIEGTAGAPPDIPWLTEDPTSGTVAPSECQEVTVTFDSTGLAPGDYFGDLLIESNDPDEPQVMVPVQLTVLPCGDLTMHVQAIDGRFEGPFLVMKVGVADQDGMPLADVEVDATLTLPFGEWARWRYTKPTGWARFWAPLLANGNYMICVDNLTLAGYTYNPDDNVVTCMDWDW